MKIKTLAILCFIPLFLLTCKKEDDDTASDPVPETINDYFPMGVGNYWIYDVYKVDTLGVEEQYSYSDTIRIIDEAVIDGNTYFVAEIDSWLSTSNKKDTLFYRDSSSYLIDLEGNFLLSLNGDTSIIQTKTFEPTPYYIEYRMAENPLTYTVPTGTFECLDFQGTFYSTDPQPGYPVRIIHNCYSKEVGIIYQNIFFASGTNYDFQRRLREYHLE